jgi:hypothetical protein
LKKTGKAGSPNNASTKRKTPSGADDRKKGRELP